MDVRCHAVGGVLARTVTQTVHQSEPAVQLPGSGQKAGTAAPSPRCDLRSDEEMLAERKNKASDFCGHL